MPNCRLALTEHFIIEWWPGKDSRGLYVIANRNNCEVSNLSRFPDGAIDGRSIPQFFVDCALVPRLIGELRSGNDSVVLLDQVTHAGFIPGFHRRPKKDGGMPDQAYYNPLPVESDQLAELADALEFACSAENVAQLEAANSDEYYSVLGNDYLEDGVWASARMLAKQGIKDINGNTADPFEVSPTLYLPATRLAQSPKGRFHAPSHTGMSWGRGFSVLRLANAQHRCHRGADPASRRSAPCLRFVWIKPGEHYLEHKQGRSVERYHLQCAFRSGVIPDNWLSPRFEQYHTLVEQGFQGWIDTERDKRTGFDDEQLTVPTYVERVEEFVRLMKSGYELDRYEREEWREHLRHVPVNQEPFLTARGLVGLLNPLV